MCMSHVYPCWCATVVAQASSVVDFGSMHTLFQQEHVLLLCEATWRLVQLSLKVEMEMQLSLSWSF